MAVHGNEVIEQYFSMNLCATDNREIHGSSKGHLGRANPLKSPLDGWECPGRPRATLYTAVGSLILNILLIVVVIKLSGTIPAQVPAALTARVGCCPDGWVGYRRRCYYFAEAERNWTSSKMHCSSLNASLTVVDSQEEVDFLRRYKTSADYWIGLQRDLETDPWRWINGTIFSNWFIVRGVGECAYMSHRGIASSSCTIEQAWICSKPAIRETRDGDSLVKILQLNQRLGLQPYTSHKGSCKEDFKTGKWNINIWDEESL